MACDYNASQLMDSRYTYTLAQRKITPYSILRTQATRNYKADVCNGGAFGTRNIISGCGVGGGGCGLLKKDQGKGNLLEKSKLTDIRYIQVFRLLVKL
jgi:hypothetical protein